MDQLDQFKWTIIYTDHQKEFIHLQHLQNSNSESQILCADISSDHNKIYAWRNSDYLVRQWLQKNVATIKYHNIAILEWDVLVTQPLPNIQVNGLIGKEYIPYNISSSQWHWFKEKELLGKYKNYAVGIAPLGVLFMDLNTIFHWLSLEFDNIYQKDIFSELRLPSILNSKLIPITSYPMPNVSWNQCVYNNQYGIHHPIKNKISLLKNES